MPSIPMSGSIIVDIGIKINAPYYNIKNISVCTNLDVCINDFIPAIPGVPEEIIDSIKMILRRDIDMNDAENQKLMKVVNKVIPRNIEGVMTFSAGKSDHHALKGGLLLHSYRVLKAGASMAGDYPEYDASLLEAGCLLHDIGRLNEYSIDDYGNVDYSDEGKLYGHPELGMMMINEMAEELGCLCGKVRQLAHIILTHHGNTVSFRGSSSLEARCVNLLDQNDVMVY